MATFEFTSPEGKVYEVEGPEGATEQEAFAILQRQLRGASGGARGAKPFDAASFGTDWRRAKEAIDALPEDQRQAALDAYANYFVGQERKDGGIGQAVSDHVRHFARNVPFGEFADEARAGVRSMFGGDYATEHAFEQARRRAIDKDNETAPSFMGVTTGDVAKAAGLVAGGMLMPWRVLGLGAARSGAIVGGTVAAADAAGQKRGSIQERAIAGVGAVPLGAALGGAGAGAGEKIAQWARHAFPVSNPISSERLRAAAKASYDVADRAGAVFSGTATGGSRGMTFAQELRSRAQQVARDMHHRGWDQTKVARILGEIDEMAHHPPGATGGRAVSFNELESLRGAIGNISRSTDNVEREMARRITEQIDDLLENMSPNDPRILQGNMKQQLTAFRNARDFWRRMRKTQIIEEAIEAASGNAKAHFAGENVDQALRRQFNNLLNNKQYKRMNMFSAEEREIMKAVVDGTLGRNAAQFLGRFDPRGGVIPAMTSLGGMYLGGPVGLGLAVSGVGGREAANRMATTAAQRAAARVSQGALRRRLTMPQMRTQAAMQHPAVRAWARTSRFAVPIASVPNQNEE